jgi:hypothetical protein
VRRSRQCQNLIASWSASRRRSIGRVALSPARRKIAARAHTARHVAKHVNADGTIDWVGVTGENGAVHDHWVDGFGNDTITDFHRAQGDKIEISAHTAEVKSIKYVDANGRTDYSLITVISQQGNAGAHDEDLLGTIKVYGDKVKASDIAVTQTVYGAYEKQGELNGAHFEIEDDGVLPADGTDGGPHNEATAALANMAIMQH